jgi:MYXO-CTERM domain-containing protein
MPRRSVWCWLAVIAAAPAAADPPRRVMVEQPPSAFTGNPAVESPYIYLNRCVGGCVVTGGQGNDARQQHTSIPPAGTYTISEFTNYGGVTGANGNCVGGSKDTTACTMDAQCQGDTCNAAAGTCNGNASVNCTTDAQCNGVCETADGDWAAVVQCMQEVYSPFAVTVTDTLPQGADYTEAIIGGIPQELDQAKDVLGIAPFASDCSAQNNVISFTFANQHPGTLATRALGVCWTAAQETAHAFGLDHEFQFVSAYPTNGNSACMDPMTYRVDCGGEKFFRNADAMCGEQTTRTCRCGGTQNSHAKLLTVFGAGQSIVPAPEVAITATPTTRLGEAWPVFAQAGSKRGVLTVELWLNGYPWASMPGGVFGVAGQVDPSNYTLTAPANVPDGIIDVVVKAYDDLGVEGDSAPVTVVKGAPCTSATTCLTGQKCSNGRCAWDPPVGQIGDSCPYPQYCVSGVCSPTTDPFCTENCTVGMAKACPSGYSCEQISGTHGFCNPSSDSGCCSTGGAGRAPWKHVVLAALVLAAATRRRQRDKSC